MTLRTHETDFRHLITLAQSAALDQRRWIWFLEALSRVAGGICVQLLGHDVRSQVPLGHIVYGYDEDFLDTFDSYYGSINAWAPAFGRMEPGHVFTTDQMVSEAELIRTEFYNDWVRPQDDIIGGAGAVLDRSPARTTLIGSNIPRRHRDKLEEPFRDLLEALLPFLQHSMDVSRMLGNQALEKHVLRAGQDPETAAIFGLNGNGQIIFSNSRGESLLTAGEVLHADVRARLRFVDTSAQNALARAMHDREMPELRVSLPFIVSGRNHGHLICRTLPVAPDDGALPWLIPASGSIDGFLLLILSPIAPRMHRTPRLPSMG